MAEGGLSMALDSFPSNTHRYAHTFMLLISGVTVLGEGRGPIIIFVISLYVL